MASVQYLRIGLRIPRYLFELVPAADDKNCVYPPLRHERRLNSLLMINMLILTCIDLGVLMTAIETFTKTCRPACDRHAPADRHRTRNAYVAH